MKIMECDGIMISSTGIECENGIKSLPTITFKLHGVPVFNGKEVGIDDNEEIAEMMMFLCSHKLRIVLKEENNGQSN